MSQETPEHQLETGALIEHIETRYHAVHRRELPELVRLAKAELNDKVPRGLPRLLERFAKDLDIHMEKEEAIAFPFMRRGGGAMVIGPIAILRGEHSEHQAWIRKLEALTNGLEPPEGVGTRCRELYTGLRKFADDLAEHIRIENDILFSRFSR